MVRGRGPRCAYPEDNSNIGAGAGRKGAALPAASNGATATGLHEGARGQLEVGESPSAVTIP